MRTLSVAILVAAAGQAAQAESELHKAAKQLVETANAAIITQWVVEQDPSLDPNTVYAEVMAEIGSGQISYPRGESLAPRRTTRAVVKWLKGGGFDDEPRVRFSNEILASIDDLETWQEIGAPLGLTDSSWTVADWQDKMINDTWLSSQGSETLVARGLLRNPPPWQVVVPLVTGGITAYNWRDSGPVASVAAGTAVSALVGLFLYQEPNVHEWAQNGLFQRGAVAALDAAVPE